MKTCNFIPTKLLAQVPSNKKVGALRLHKEQNFTSAKGVQGLYVSYRKSCTGDYRYGFNGKEKDNEIKGDGNNLDFGARIYDSRLGRWLSLDPLQEKYPSLSPYNFCANNPIMYVDPDGKKIIKAQAVETFSLPATTYANDLGVTAGQADFSFAFNSKTNVFDMNVVTYTNYSSVLDAPSGLMAPPTSEFESTNPGFTGEVKNHERGHQDQVFEGAKSSISITYNGKNYKGTGDVVLTKINADNIKRATIESESITNGGIAITETDKKNYIDSKTNEYNNGAVDIIKNEVNKKISTHMKSIDAESDANNRASKKVPLKFANGALKIRNTDGSELKFKKEAKKSK
jgi:RHS repeat-associated protein